MFQELTKGNPAAAEWFAIPENQDLALSTLLPGSVQPDEAQRLKTEADIQTIIERGPQVAMGTDGSSVQELPVHPEKWENFAEAKKVLSRHLLKHYELRIQDPIAWDSLNKYWDELDEMDMQVAAQAANRQMQVTKAGQPAPPAPDRNEETEMRELLQVAAPAIQRLLQLAQTDPSLTKGTASAQVAAGKEIVEATLEAAKLKNGSK